MRQVCSLTGSCGKFVGRLVHVTSLLADWLLPQVCKLTGSCAEFVGRLFPELLWRTINFFKFTTHDRLDCPFLPFYMLEGSIVHSIQEVSTVPYNHIFVVIL